MNLPVYFCRRFVEPQEAYRNSVSSEMLERNDERFAKLLGQDAAHRWREEGVDYEKLAQGIKASRNRFA